MMISSTRDIPQAHSFQVRFCGACPNGHLISYDADGVPICQAVLSAQQAQEIADKIRANDPNFRAE
jgi:hypothetical protein